MAPVDGTEVFDEAVTIEGEFDDVADDGDEEVGVVDVDGSGGPIWGPPIGPDPPICSLRDFSIAPKGSILLTDSLNWLNGPPPELKSELRSNWDPERVIPFPELPLPLPPPPMPMTLVIIEPLLIPATNQIFYKILGIKPIRKPFHYLNYAINNFQKKNYDRFIF